MNKKIILILLVICSFTVAAYADSASFYAGTGLSLGDTDKFGLFVNAGFSPDSNNSFGVEITLSQMQYFSTAAFLYDYRFDLDAIVDLSLYVKTGALFYDTSEERDYSMLYDFLDVFSLFGDEVHLPEQFIPAEVSPFALAGVKVSMNFLEPFEVLAKMDFGLSYDPKWSAFAPMVNMGIGFGFSLNFS